MVASRHHHGSDVTATRPQQHGRNVAAMWRRHSSDMAAAFHAQRLPLPCYCHVYAGSLQVAGRALVIADAGMADVGVMDLRGPL